MHLKYEMFKYSCAMAHLSVTEAVMYKKLFSVAAIRGGAILSFLHSSHTEGQFNKASH